jgi:hypothetical protein
LLAAFYRTVAEDPGHQKKQSLISANKLASCQPIGGGLRIVCFMVQAEFAGVLTVLSVFYHPNAEPFGRVSCLFALALGEQG